MEFFQGGAPRDFSKIFPRGPKVVKFVFFSLETKKITFLLKFSKSKDAHGSNCIQMVIESAASLFLLAHKCICIY